MVDFLTQNPGGLDRIASNIGQMESSRLRTIRMQREQSELDNAERTRRQSRAVDNATRGAVTDYLAQAEPQAGGGGATPARTSAPPLPPVFDSAAQASAEAEVGRTPVITVPAPAPARPTGLRRSLAGRLASVPGGGQAAAQMAIAGDDREHQIALKTFDMALTNPDAAETFAAQNGMPVPPELKKLIHNRQLAGYMKSLLQQAKDLYPGEHQAGPRMQFFMQQVRGLDAALKERGGLPPEIAAGVPRGDLPAPVEKPRTDFQFLNGVDAQGNPVIVRGNRSTGAVEPTAVRGFGAGRGAGGKPPATVEAAQWLAGMTAKAEGRQATPQDHVKAFNTIQMAKTNPVAKAQLVLRAYTAMKNDVMDGRGDAEKQAAAQQFVDGLIAGNEAAPVAPSAPQQPGAAPSPTFDDGQTQGTFSGQYEGGKPVYTTPDGRRFVVE